MLNDAIPETDGPTCDQRREHIAGTRHARILRVPFRSESGETIGHWISRFEIWPYLEHTEARRYLGMLYSLQFGPLAQALEG